MKEPPLRIYIGGPTYIDGQDWRQDLKAPERVSLVLPAPKTPYEFYDEIAERDFRLLDSADALYCWLDRPSRCGSLVEIGWASALGLQIVVCVPEGSAGTAVKRDAQFALAVADHWTTAPDPQTGLNIAVEHLQGGDNK